MKSTDKDYCSKEQEVKFRIIQMSKRSFGANRILQTLKSEFPEVCVRSLVVWIDDLIQN